MVVIVGGGLLGCAVAEALASRGQAVTVLERAVVGAEASSAAGGILAPRIEAHGREPLRAFGIASLDMYEGWVRRLGVEVGFARCGALSLRPESPDADAVWRDDARTIEPAIGASGAWWLPEEGVVDPRRLVPAVSDAARAAGAVFRTAVVRAVHPDGVELDGGELLRGRVVVCAGAWTGRVPGLEGAPVRPVRGQIVALEGVPLRRVVFGPGGYVVPRPADLSRVLAGATVEEAGFDKAVTVEGLRAVLDTAVRLAPALAGARVAETWAGLRPGTPDELPIVGEQDGVWIASGHYRNGILLAPITARWVAEGLLDGAPTPRELRPGRFG
jgi:glycine oxidase